MARRTGSDGVVKRATPDGAVKRSVTDEDVEGHIIKKNAPDGVVKRADADGLVKRSVTDEDEDVEGHMIGLMNPVMARELARAKERDIQRSTSRANLISEAKRAIRRKD